MMLTCNHLEAMKVWGELAECFCGRNRYGGHAGEIYSYRLEPFAARIKNEVDDEEELRLTHGAAMNLGEIIEAFIEYYECKVFMGEEKQKFSVWFNKVKRGKATYYHRYHIDVVK